MERGKDGAGRGGDGRGRHRRARWALLLFAAWIIASPAGGPGTTPDSTPGGGMSALRLAGGERAAAAPGGCFYLPGTYKARIFDPLTGTRSALNDLFGIPDGVIAQGAQVTITFVVDPTCRPSDAPGNRWEFNLYTFKRRTYNYIVGDPQWLVGVDTALCAANAVCTLQTTVPTCYWQIDLMSKSNTLIEDAAGFGDNACAGFPVPGAGPTPIPNNPPPPPSKCPPGATTGLPPAYAAGSALLPGGVAFAPPIVATPSGLLAVDPGPPTLVNLDTRFTFTPTWVLQSPVQCTDVTTARFPLQTLRTGTGNLPSRYWSAPTDADIAAVVAATVPPGVDPATVSIVDAGFVIPVWWSFTPTAPGVNPGQWSEGANQCHWDFGDGTPEVVRDCGTRAAPGSATHAYTRSSVQPAGGFDVDVVEVKQYWLLPTTLHYHYNIRIAYTALVLTCSAWAPPVGGGPPVCVNEYYTDQPVVVTSAEQTYTATTWTVPADWPAMRPYVSAARPPLTPIGAPWNDPLFYRIQKVRCITVLQSLPSVTGGQATGTAPGQTTPAVGCPFEPVWYP